MHPNETDKVTDQEILQHQLRQDAYPLQLRVWNEMPQRRFSGPTFKQVWLLSSRWSADSTDSTATQRS